MRPIASAPSIARAASEESRARNRRIALIRARHLAMNANVDDRDIKPAKIAKPRPRSSTATYMKQVRARARADGRCTMCTTRPARPGRATCAECCARVVATKKRWQAEGRCTRCSAPLDTDRRNCSACLLELSTKNKARADARKAAGLCARCGKPATGGYSLCEPHRAASIAHTAAHREKKGKATP